MRQKLDPGVLDQIPEVGTLFIPTGSADTLNRLRDLTARAPKIEQLSILNVALRRDETGDWGHGHLRSRSDEWARVEKLLDVLAPRLRSLAWRLGDSLPHGKGDDRGDPIWTWIKEHDIARGKPWPESTADRVLIF